MPNRISELGDLATSVRGDVRRYVYLINNLFLARYGKGLVEVARRDWKRAYAEALEVAPKHAVDAIFKALRNMS